MRVFISCSGDRSNSVARALEQWLPLVINAVHPWLSSENLEKGTRWVSEISGALADSKFGIICLTAENLHADWVLFEAGALSKTLEQTFVCTFLIDLKPADVGYPLAQFQATVANRAETLRLLQTINRAVEKNLALPESQLVKAFELLWPKLESELSKLPPPEVEVPKRTDRELLEEVLALLHGATQSLDEKRLERPILQIRLLLRELAAEMDVGVPPYDFSWDRNHLHLHLDNNEVSTRAIFRLPISDAEARGDLRAALARFPTTSELTRLEN